MPERYDISTDDGVIEQAAAAIASLDGTLPWVDIVRQYPDDADWYRTAARAVAAALSEHTTRKES